MAKNNNTWSIEDWLLLFGGSWLLHQVFKTPTQAGIGALPEAERFLFSYYNNDKVDVTVQDMQQYNADEINQIIKLIIKARLKPQLTMPLMKPFEGSKFIDIEFRDVTNGWRIFCKRLADGEYLMLSIFKKKTQKTPKYEIEKAEARAKEWATHKTLVRKPRAKR